MIAALKNKRGKRKKVNSAILQASCSLWEEQLYIHLRDPFSKFFRQLFKEVEDRTERDSKDFNKDKKFDVLVEFQKELQLVKGDGRIKRFLDSPSLTSIPLSEIFRIVAICKTMVMGSIRPDSLADKLMPLEIAPIEKSVALALRCIAKYLFFYPSTVRIEEFDTEEKLFYKTERLERFIRDGIRDSLNESLPISRLVDTYGLRENDYSSTITKNLKVLSEEKGEDKAEEIKTLDISKEHEKKKKKIIKNIKDIDKDEDEDEDNNNGGAKDRHVQNHDDDDDDDEDDDNDD